jgi:hypothetical protein
VSDKSTRISRLKQSTASRASYTRAKLSILIPSQIRALRIKFFNTQEALGKEAEMKQSRVSAMERPGSVQFNIETLIRIAAACKVGLIVRFVPFSEMLRWENDFNQDTFSPLTIDQDSEFNTGNALGPVPSFADLEQQVHFGSLQPPATGAASELGQTHCAIQ